MMMAEEGSVTVVVLREIRDEVRGLRGEVGELRGEVRHTNERLDRTNERLDAVVQEQIRASTAIVALEAGQRELDKRVRQLTRVVSTGFETLAARIDNVLVGPMGGAVRDLGKRVRRLEKHVGLKKPRRWTQGGSNP